MNRPEINDARKFEFFETLAYLELEREQRLAARRAFMKAHREDMDALNKKRAAILERLESGQMELGDD